jgi:RHS repeat-associated protein
VHEVQYLHPDHLGSIGSDALARQSITSQTGAWVQDVYFHPYGGIRWSQSGGNAISPTSSTRRTYTGQYDIGFWAGSLMHYNARQYSPVLGRFLQPDTLVQDPGDPATLNRFSYVLNDPINHNDPTGHCADPLSGTLCLIGVGAAGIAAAPVGLVVLGAVAVVAVLYVTYELTVSANAEQNRQAIANVFAPMPKPMLSETAKENDGDVEIPGLSEPYPETHPVLWNPETRAPDIPLPRTEDGVNIPSSPNPHTQLGTRVGRDGVPYRQTREWDENGVPLRDTDWTDHGRPGLHANPHDHWWLPNPTGGSMQRGAPVPRPPLMPQE